ncbi:hypothetical protein HY624_03850 [Candidatus Uhrbacteria bacterium]|nr:hypothetical protein [Candidatus Uhrbacteria bacterium]
MYFWKRKIKEMPDDLKVVEERLRMHAEKTAGPSDEFQGRLEARLDIAWQQRQRSALHSRVFTFIPQVAIGCAVVVLAFVSANLTTISLQAPEHIDEPKQPPAIKQQEMPTQERMPQKFFNAFAPSLESAMKPDAPSEERIIPRAVPHDAFGDTTPLARTSAFATTTDVPDTSVIFAFRFLAYLCGLGILWILTRLLYHRLRK